ncbi:hypothetical protein [Breoghania sp.]|uniref:hypothetical protein n=1 Tax=Breoghania sp. TaxID=2065378 RepID=UPI002620F631|nr:hypothetical protein [Breoghania sp.]MDJ0929584.1 hypothetical protein [Breoghania sp.]
MKIGHLLGEPVVSSQFRFDLQGGTVTLPSSTTLTGTDYGTHRLAVLPLSAVNMSSFTT